MSQPRHSDLWYLPEVDEGAADSLESVEDSSSTPDNISNASDPASPIMDVAAPDIPDTTSVTKEDISSSPSAEVTSLKPDGSLSISETTMPSSEVVSAAAAQVMSQIPPVTSEVKIIPPGPEPETCPTQEEEIKEEKTALPLLPQEDTTVRRAASDTPRRVSGPSVRSAISRFQTGTLDPRMVWTGTKKDAEQAERVTSNFRSFNTQRPVSQQFSSPKPNNPLYRVGPVFLRTQSTPKLEIPKRPISDGAIPHARAHEGLTPASPNSSVDDVKHDTAISPVSSELKASNLPKVSELKKKFEADTLQ